MKFILMRITFISLLLLVLFISNPSYSAAERRIALVIGNGSYDFGRLKNSVNDANDIAATLKKLGFSVILKNEAGHKEMESAIKELGKQLKKDDVGLFFYAGHGVQIEGQNYLIPIGANIEEESDVKYKAVNLNRIFETMDDAGNKLNIIILDACRNNPYAKSFRSTSRGLAIVEKSPKDTLIAYSTSPNQVAMDGSGRNSPYTKALLDNMTIPGIPIEQVFKKIRNNLDNVTGGKQVPWYISSLGGDFYFNTERVTAQESSKPERIKQSDETKKLAEEKRRLEVERKTLEKERSALAIKNKQLAMGKRPSVSTANEIRRDGRFVAYDNGTVLDTKTNLMWAARDNGSKINWTNAKSYCENYRGGGYSDWRMPMQYELARLYDGSKQTSAGPRLTDLIQLTIVEGYVWAAETEGSFASAFVFTEGRIAAGVPQSYDQYRALPVRSSK